MDSCLKEFNWREQSNYVYNALNYLKTDVRNLNIYNYNYLCIYKINNENKYPFLQFLFHKNIVTDNYSFLSYIDFDFNNEDNDFIIKIKKYICSIINKQNINTELLSSSNSSNNYLTLKNIVFNGFLDQLNNNYLFLS